MKSSMTSLIPKLNNGLDVLYNDVFANGACSNKKYCNCKKSRNCCTSSDVNPVAALQKKAPCVMEALGNSMLLDVRSLLTSFLR